MCDDGTCEKILMRPDGGIFAIAIPGPRREPTAEERAWIDQTERELLEAMAEWERAGRPDMSESEKALLERMSS